MSFFSFGNKKARRAFVSIRAFKNFSSYPASLQAWTNALTDLKTFKRRD
jgi:hypothetical protein